MALGEDGKNWDHARGGNGWVDNLARFEQNFEFLEDSPFSEFSVLGGIRIFMLTGSQRTGGRGGDARI